MKSLPLMAALALVATAAHAQERTAAGSMETQMTWSTLKTLTDDANAKSTAAHTRIDQLEKCGAKGLFYAPSATGADAQGCIGGGSSQIESGTVNTGVPWANQTVKVTFKKPFKTVPTVTVALRNFQYQDKCKEDYLHMSANVSAVTTTGFTVSLSGYLWGCQQSNISSVVWLAHD